VGKQDFWGRGFVFNRLQTPEFRNDFHNNNKKGLKQNHALKALQAFTF